MNSQSVIIKHVNKNKWVNENKTFKPEDLEYQNCQLQNTEKWYIFKDTKDKNTKLKLLERTSKMWEKHKTKKFLKI